MPTANHLGLLAPLQKPLMKHRFLSRTAASGSPLALLAGGVLGQQPRHARGRSDKSSRAPSAIQEGSSHTFDFVVEHAEPQSRQRLDAYLCKRVPNATRSRIQASIRRHGVLVNGEPAKPSYNVRPGDAISCSLVAPGPLEARPESLGLKIVHEDEHVLVVDKAAGMVVHPSPGHWSGTLVNGVLHHCNLATFDLRGRTAMPRSLDGLEDEQEIGEGEWDGLGGGADFRPGIVHRLDKNTTGLLVVAKTEMACASLGAQFQEKSTGRKYVAIVVGCPQDDFGVVRTNVGRDAKDRKKMACYGYQSQHGRPAVSRFKVLERLPGGGAALIAWKLETGRTHQIRVHSQFLDSPVFGDEAYGGTGKGVICRVANDGRRDSEAFVQELITNLNRPALHAVSLDFQHPQSGDRLHFQSRIPDDFEICWTALKSIN